MEAMALMRVIVLAVVSAVLWQSAGFGEHGGPALHPSAHEPAAHAAMLAASSEEPANDCCSDTVELGSSCTTILAVAPLCSDAEPASGRATAIVWSTAHLPDGRQPFGLLEPPRTV